VGFARTPPNFCCVLICAHRSKQTPLHGPVRARAGPQERAKILAEKESAHREKEALIEKIELQLARREKRLAKEKARVTACVRCGEGGIGLLLAFA
jgi:hypothetical protein